MVQDLVKSLYYYTFWMDICGFGSRKQSLLFGINPSYQEITIACKVITVTWLKFKLCVISLAYVCIYQSLNLNLIARYMWLVINNLWHFFYCHSILQRIFRNTQKLPDLLNFERTTRKQRLPPCSTILVRELNKRVSLGATQHCRKISYI